MRLLLSLLGWLFTFALTGAIVAVVAGFLLFQHYSHDLPDYSKLAHYDPPTVTRLYAADGKLLAEYALEKRVFVPLNAIPKRVRDAFIAAEDKNFYQNQGIDIGGILRAIRTNIVNYGQGRSMVGGSTITQQVVKNFLLTDEKSIERKVKEAILAVRISQVYSKDKILELYLNEIFLGRRSYGVAAAALNYYDKPLEDLTVEEAALLAAQPKGPSNYDPRLHPEAAKSRRDWVIHRMAEDGYITGAEADAAVKEPITLRTRSPDDIAHADYFAEEVRRWLAVHYGDDALYEGGLVVRTTLDPTLQDYADHALRAALVAYDRRRGWRGPVSHLPTLAGFQLRLEALAKIDHHVLPGQQLGVVTAMDARTATLSFADGKTAGVPFALMKWMHAAAKKPDDVLSVGDVVITQPASDEQKKALAKTEAKNPWDIVQVPAVNGALVVMDPHSGRVLALSGGYAYSPLDSFDRATQAKRQPGSSFKPFAYMAGLENGLTPSTILIDGPIEMSQGEGLPMWRPQNYEEEYLGPATMRVGLEKSRNTMTVRLAQMIGLDPIIAMGKRMGIYDELPHNFSIVLGAAETTLLRMTNAYSMIDNGGHRITPALIERVDDRHGKIIYRRDARDCTGCQVADAQALAAAMSGAPPIPADGREQVLDPRVAYQMTSMLEGVVARGTGVRARVLGRPVAGKTGTTNNSMDTWFVGFTPNLAAGVFVGYDQPKTLGKKETGASVALPGFIDFMQAALKGKPPVPFRIPPGIQLVRVDLKTGLPVTPSAPSDHPIEEAFVTGGPLFIPGVSPTTQGTTTPPPPPTGDITPPLPEGHEPPPPKQEEDETPVGTGGLY